jgi:hypothetical protein
MSFVGKKLLNKSGSGEVIAWSCKATTYTTILRGLSMERNLVSSWFGLDPGFYPWDYLPYYAGDYYPYDYYTDVQPDHNTAPASAYPYSYYTGVQPDYNTPLDNAAPGPDPTIEAIQERLAQLGYYKGSVDGIFGPTTRDAVAKYQIDNQLDVTGSLSPDTLQSLGVPLAPNN